ncbi:hypothetical protein, partial [Prevotella sp.]|uniref:hypothetical protein n=1 Tax=Prevotella sp. TaxID=59823 RepID=UPI0040295421
IQNTMKQKKHPQYFSTEPKTGHNYMQELGRRLIEQEKKEEKERQEHWGRWALKKLAKSTVSGIFGGYSSSK